MVDGSSRLERCHGQVLGEIWKEKLITLDLIKSYQRNERITHRSEEDGR